MFNRHQILMAGFIVLLLGAQLRLVQTYVFADSARSFIDPVVEKKSDLPQAARAGEADGGNRQYVLHVPDFMGWVLLSIGGALVLHSLSLPKIKYATPGRIE